MKFLHTRDICHFAWLPSKGVGRRGERGEGETETENPTIFKFIDTLNIIRHTRRSFHSIKVFFFFSVLFFPPVFFFLFILFPIDWQPWTFDGLLSIWIHRTILEKSIFIFFGPWLHQARTCQVSALLTRWTLNTNLKIICLNKTQSTDDNNVYYFFVFQADQSI